jgi:hypothetical protein
MRRKRRRQKKTAPNTQTPTNIVSNMNLSLCPHNAVQDMPQGNCHNPENPVPKHFLWLYGLCSWREYCHECVKTEIDIDKTPERGRTHFLAHPVPAAPQGVL